MLRSPIPSDFDDGRLSQRYRAAMERSHCLCCGGGLDNNTVGYRSSSRDYMLICHECDILYVIYFPVGNRAIAHIKGWRGNKTGFISFVSAILADPLDDTNRLVFADWLEEHDEPNRACYQRLEVAKRDVLREPQSDEARLRYADVAETYGEVERAEFIRAQLELAKTPAWDDFECKVCSAKPNEEGEIRHGRGCYMLSEDGGGEEWADENPKHEVLRMQCAKLVDNPNGQWFKWIYPLDDSGRVRMVERMETRRGFVHSITLSAAQAEMYLDEVLEEQPVQEVTLSTPIQLTNGIEMREGKPHVLIAGKWVDYSVRQNPRGTYIASYPELDKIMLNARWPSVPVEGWKLPPVNAFDAASQIREWLEPFIPGVGLTPRVIRDIMGLDQPLSPDEPLTPR